MNHRIARIITVATLLITATLAVTGTESEAKTSYPCPKYHKMLREHGLPVKIFAPIMWRESKCKPKAIGWNYRDGMSHRDCKLSHARTYRKCKAVKSYDVGLLQINSSWVTLTAKVCKAKRGKMLVLQKPSCNLKVAAVLYAGGKGLANWQGTSGRMSVKK